jgi:hypothetical protein
MNLFTGTESPDSPHTRNTACFSAIRSQYYCRSFLLFRIPGQQGSIETLPKWRLFCGSFSFSMNIGVSYASPRPYWFLSYDQQGNADHQCGCPACAVYMIIYYLLIHEQVPERSLLSWKKQNF